MMYSENIQIIAVILIMILKLSQKTENHRNFQRFTGKKAEARHKSLTMLQLPQHLHNFTVQAKSLELSCWTKLLTRLMKNTLKA